MRRFERRRVERVRRTATLVGLSFALGALVDVALTWRLDEFDLPAGTATNHQAPATTRRLLPAVGTTGPGPTANSDIEELRDRDLEIPVEGVDDDDLRDTFADARGTRPHEALDIMAPRHTPVVAVEDGVIAKVYDSRGGGGLSLYQFDPANTYCYYYAHLDRYADGVRDGSRVRRGQVIGYVGSTGNASPDAPHLHFAIFRLTPERLWWKGEPINAYSVLR
jgi:murein DD-endopeptidase MepM/ murein hydrolase activator NlpD